MTTDQSPTPPAPETAAVAADHAAISRAHAAIADVADGVERRLDPRYVMLQRTAAIIGTVVAGVVWLLVAFAIVRATDVGADWAEYVFVAAAALTLLDLWWGQRKPAIAYRHASYRVDADGIAIRRGVFWWSAIHVPRSRVQHTDVSQGPLERRFGLGTLSIFTAGTHHAQVSLPGLDHALALRIRDALRSREEDDAV